MSDLRERVLDQLAYVDKEYNFTYAPNVTPRRKAYERGQALRAIIEAHACHVHDYRESCPVEVAARELGIE
jgi:hypothetical protein